MSYSLLREFGPARVQAHFVLLLHPLIAEAVRPSSVGLQGPDGKVETETIGETIRAVLVAPNRWDLSPHLLNSILSSDRDEDVDIVGNP